MLFLWCRLLFTKRNGRHNIGRGPKTKLENLNSKTSKKRCNFNAKYREPDGTCNNRHFPNEYGVAYIPFRRYVLIDVVNTK